MFQWVFIRYEVPLVLGLVIAFLSALNVLGLTNINGDFFWMLAGLGVAAEAFLAIIIGRSKEVQQQLQRDLNPEEVEWLNRMQAQEEALRRLGND